MHCLPAHIQLQFDGLGYCSSSFNFITGRGDTILVSFYFLCVILRASSNSIEFFFFDFVLFCFVSANKVFFLDFLKFDLQINCVCAQVRYPSSFTFTT